MFVAPDAGMIDALVGRYRLSNGLGMALRHQGDALTIRPTASPNSTWATTAPATCIL